MKESAFTVAKEFSAEREMTDESERKNRNRDEERQKGEVRKGETGAEMKSEGNRISKLLLTAGAAAAGLYIAPKIMYAVLEIPRKEKAFPGKKEIACVGDSITFGTGVIWHRKRDAWPCMLERLLGEEYQVLNYGISGASVQRESDKPYRPDFMKSVTDMEAEAIILMLGSNDSKAGNWNPEQFERAYSETIELLSAATRKLYVMIPPRAFVVGWRKKVKFGIRNEVVRDEIHPILLRQAKIHHVPVIDLYRLTETHPEYFEDGVHPNQLGNKVIAEYVYDQINRQ